MRISDWSSDVCSSDLKLGYDEVFVGEHYTATSEPITDPLQFLATLIPETRSIKLGTGVFNLPQHHPLQIAGNAALFDNLSGGRLLMGIGPGGLGSEIGRASCRERVCQYV